MFWHFFWTVFIPHQVKGTRKYERVIWDRLSHSLMNLFHNGGLLMFSFICTIISLSDHFGMCKIQKNSYFQKRPERVIMVHIKDDSQEDINVIGRHIERDPWKSFLKQVGSTYAPRKHKFDLNILIKWTSWSCTTFPYFPPRHFPVDPWKFHGNFPHTGSGKSLTTIQQNESFKNNSNGLGKMSKKWPHVHVR